MGDKEITNIQLSVAVTHTDLFNFLKKTGDLLALQPTRLGDKGVEIYRELSAALVNASTEDSLKGIISGALEINPVAGAAKPLLKFQQNSGNESEV